MQRSFLEHSFNGHELSYNSAGSMIRLRCSVHGTTSVVSISYQFSLYRGSGEYDCVCWKPDDSLGCVGGDSLRYCFQFAGDRCSEIKVCTRCLYHHGMKVGKAVDGLILYSASKCLEL